MPHATEILGLLSALLGVIGYGFYYRNIYVKKVPPHFFTWLPLSIILGFAFFAQLVSGETWGAVATGVTAANCAALAVIGAFFRVKKASVPDIVCFTISLLGIAWWRATGDLAISVAIMTAADLFAFAPTVFRGYREPFAETWVTWACASAKFAVAISILETHSVATLLFPLTLAISNALFVLLIIVRRKYLWIKYNLSENYGGTN